MNDATRPMLHVLSAGAARTIVQSIHDSGFGDGRQGAFEAGFGPVGAIRELFLAGEPCDVLILSRSAIDDLAASGFVDGATVATLGGVSTGLAVRELTDPPVIDDESSLRSCLLAADSIHVPDRHKSTAGAHVAQVLERLGVGDAIADRLHEHPSGTIAMEELARSAGFAIGCTQVTEILEAAGVTLVGPFPPGFELTTEYAGAITTRATNHALAAAFLGVLTGDATAGARRRAGFEID